ncbi:MAG: NosD domain-containing protein, partial [Candidatus Zixiibacteriota bacterium]
FSDSCTYEGNRFSGNGAGVAVMYTRHVRMIDNEFSNNWGGGAYGLLLKEITDSEISGSRFHRNSVGVFAEGVIRATVSDCQFTENGWAIKIRADSDQNLFTANNFIGNTFDVATNSRQNYSVFDGNYWSSYSGYDLDRDGAGDIPYHPVSLFSLIVEKQPPALALLRSAFVDLLEVAERALPALTPETLVDNSPRMEPLQ